MANKYALAKGEQPLPEPEKPVAQRATRAVRGPPPPEGAGREVEDDQDEDDQEWMETSIKYAELKLLTLSFKHWSAFSRKKQRMCANYYTIFDTMSWWRKSMNIRSWHSYMRMQSLMRGFVHNIGRKWLASIIQRWHIQVKHSKQVLEKISAVQTQNAQELSAARTALVKAINSNKELEKLRVAVQAELDLEKLTAKARQSTAASVWVNRTFKMTQKASLQVHFEYWLECMTVHVPKWQSLAQRLTRTAANGICDVFFRKHTMKKQWQRLAHQYSVKDDKKCAMRLLFTQGKDNKSLQQTVEHLEQELERKEEELTQLRKDKVPILCPPQSDFQQVTDNCEFQYKVLELQNKTLQLKVDSLVNTLATVEQTNKENQKQKLLRHARYNLLSSMFERWRTEVQTEVDDDAQDSETDISVDFEDGKAETIFSARSPRPWDEQQRIAKISADFEKQIADIQANMEAEHARQLNSMRADLENEITNMREDLEKKNAALKAADSAIVTLSEDHLTELQVRDTALTSALLECQQLQDELAVVRGTEIATHPDHDAMMLAALDTSEMHMKRIEQILPDLHAQVARVTQELCACKEREATGDGMFAENAGNEESTAGSSQIFDILMNTANAATAAATNVAMSADATVEGVGSAALHFRSGNHQ